MARIATRPMDRTATREANDEFYANHPEMVQDGRRVPLDPCNPEHDSMRTEWMDLYEANGGEVRTGRISRTCGEAVEPCTTASPCCGCVTSVAIQNVRSFSGATGFVSPNTGRTLYNGHAFDFVMNLAFSAGSSGTSDCTCEWWERVNLPAHATHPAGTWTEMMTVGSPGSPTFGPWDRRVIPCPGGGNLTVTITDPPSLGNAPGRTLTRTLEFRLVARSGSGSGCGCGIASATATATQVLVMVNGTLDTSASSFTIGSSSTTP